MIDVRNISKSFGSYVALDDITLKVEDGTVYGLVGYNGAGKTTLLKIVAGVYKPDAGCVLVDGASMHAARTSHDSVFIVADEPYFLPQATPQMMRAFYRGYYPDWSDDVFNSLMSLFDLDATAKVIGFSKGMQRQLGILIGFSTGAHTILLDESFDGLDLGKRKLLKRLMRQYATDRRAAIILASHNLHELEDAVDCLGMIKGSRLSFDGTVNQIHKDYPNASLEQIFLAEGNYAEQDIEGIFDE